jgi:hypothetical protein
MGPVDIFFLILVAIWGAIGIVRNYHRELGVTLLLFTGLFVLIFAETRFPNQVAKLLEFVAGPDPARQAAVQALFCCGFLIFMAFIAYQGEILGYPGTTNNSFLSWLVGLLNGYLIAGSIWYYLARGQWPFNLVQPPYSQLYYAIYPILPPAIFKWPYLILLIVIMIILRVIK